MTDKLYREDKSHAQEEGNPVPTPQEPAPSEPSAPEQPSEPSEPSPAPDQGGKVPDQIKEALNIGYVSTIAASPSVAMANLYQHQVNHTRRLDSLAEASLGMMLKDFVTPDPVEAMALSKLFKGEADSSILSLLAQLGAGQQAAKVAQSTPGDLALEINKLGSSIASLQALVVQLGGMLGTSA